MKYTVCRIGNGYWGVFVSEGDDAYPIAITDTEAEAKEEVEKHKSRVAAQTMGKAMSTLKEVHA